MLKRRKAFFLSVILLLSLVFSFVAFKNADAVMQCADGIDNDSDGSIDMADTGCYNNQASDESPKINVSVNGQGVIASVDPATFLDVYCGQTRNRCAGEQTTGSSINLYAFPVSGYVLSSWGGACTGSISPCSVLLDTTKTVTATFVPAPACSNGIDDDGDGALDYNALSGGDPGCSSATDNDEGMRLRVTVGGRGTINDTTSAIACDFRTGYNGTSAGSAKCTADFNTNTSVVLAAIPASGYTFSQWVGDCSGTSPTCTLPMNTKKDVAALFVPSTVTYTLTINNAGTKIATVKSNPTGVNCAAATCSYTFTSGTFLRLYANLPSTAQAGGLGWSGCQVEAYTPDAPCEILMDQSRTVVVTAQTKTLSTNSLNIVLAGNGQGLVTSVGAANGTLQKLNCGHDDPSNPYSGSETCNVDYNNTETVVLTAAPRTGSTFGGWSGDALSCGTNLSCSLSMASTRNVTATFNYNGSTGPVYDITWDRRGNTVSGNTTGITISSSPPGVSCGADCVNPYSVGTVLTINMSLASGHTFGSYHDDAGGSTGQVQNGWCNGDAPICIYKILSPSKSYAYGSPYCGDTLDNEADGYRDGCYGGGSCSPATTRNDRGCQVPASPVTPLNDKEDTDEDPTVSMDIVSPGTAAGRINISSPVGVNNDPLGPSDYCADTFSGPSGNVDCSFHFTSGANVNLQAVPVVGYTLGGWANDCSGITSGCGVISSRTMKVTAFMGKQSQLKVVKLGSGTGTINFSNPNTISCGQTCRYRYLPTDSVNLTASPDVNMTFVGWGGACSGTGMCSVAMNTDQVVTANFSAPACSDGIDNDGDGNIDFNLTNPNRDTGCSSSTDNDEGPKLTVTVSGTGTINSNPVGISNCTATTGTCNYQYNTGTPVILTAAPGPSQQTVWGVGCTVDGANPNLCTATMDTSKTVTVTFAQTPRTLTTGYTSVRGGTGSVQVTYSGNTYTCTNTVCNYSIPDGTPVTLTAFQGTNSTFVRWVAANTTSTSTDCPAGSPCTFNINGDKTVYAEFRKFACSDTNGAVAYDNDGDGLANYPNDPGCTGPTDDDENPLLTVNVSNSTGLGFTVNSSPTGIDLCTAFNPGSAACTEHFSTGLSVVLTSTPAAPGTSITWTSGCDSSSGNVCNVTMGTTKVVNVSYVALPDCSNGIDDDGDGLIDLADPGCSGTGDTDEGRKLTVTVSGSGAVSATAATGDSFNPAPNPPQILNCVSGAPVANCNDHYNSNSNITLTATPGSGMQVSWAGCTTAVGNTCTVIMNADNKSVSATFGTAPACSDGLDNDGDGFKDYGTGPTNDPGCTSAIDPDEGPVLTVSVSGDGTVTATTPSPNPPPDPPSITDCVTGGAAATCSEHYSQNTVVTLHAVPGAGQQVTWLDCVDIGSNYCQTTVSANKTVFATFSPLSGGTIYVSRAGAPGRVYSRDGAIRCGDETPNDCQTGMRNITLFAEASPASEPSIFMRWTRGTCAGSTDPMCSVVATPGSDLYVTALFNWRFTYGHVDTHSGSSHLGFVSLLPADSPMILCYDPICTYYTTSGAALTLNAWPNSGTIFERWVGPDGVTQSTVCSGNTSPCRISPNTNITVYALFRLPRCSDGVDNDGDGKTDYASDGTGDTGCTGPTDDDENPILTTTLTGSGTGSVTSLPIGISCGSDCNEEYATGDQIVLTALPDANSVFAGWSNNCEIVNATSCRVTMDMSHTVTAIFQPAGTTYNLFVVATQFHGYRGTPAGRITGPNDSNTEIDCVSNILPNPSTGDCSETYNSGTVVRLKRISEPNHGFRWYVSPVSNPGIDLTPDNCKTPTSTNISPEYCTVNMTADLNIQGMWDNTQCSDNIDNSDQDGKVDFQNIHGPTAEPQRDPGCVSWDDDNENDSGAVEICTNNIDDDGDGLVDTADPDCPPTGTEICTNNIDDDGDGLVDTADPDCPTISQCNDGIDNDQDGNIDSADPNCPGTNEGVNARCNISPSEAPVGDPVTWTTTLINPCTAPDATVDVTWFDHLLGYTGLIVNKTYNSAGQYTSFSQVINHSASDPDCGGIVQTSQCTGTESGSPWVVIVPAPEAVHNLNLGIISNSTPAGTGSIAEMAVPLPDPNPCTAESCIYQVVGGTTLSLIAEPNDATGAGSVFVRWVGGPCDGSSDRTCILVMPNLDTTIKAEFKISQCSDGIDNNFVSGQPSNGIDSDGCLATGHKAKFVGSQLVCDAGGTITVGADLSCVSPIDDAENGSNTACSDGLDNDVPPDGFIDAADKMCHTDRDPNNPNSYDPNLRSEQDPRLTTTDCNVADESGNPITVDCGPATACNDGQDNDNDNLIDWQGACIINASGLRVYGPSGFINSAADCVGADRTWYPADPFCQGDINRNAEGFKQIFQEF